MESLGFLVQGLEIALQPLNLLFAFIGCLIGTLVGVLPGIGPISGVALLIPVTAAFTSGLPPEDAATSSIILLAGVYYGAMYGGSTTAILINTPGENSSVCTTLDGYQMAKQGRAGAALAICAIASFVAGLIATIGLLFMAKPLAEMALKFSPAGQFSLMILGLCALSSLAGKSVVKAFIMTTSGLILSTVGVDPISGVARMTFGYSELYGQVPGGQAEYVRVPKANTGPFKVPGTLADEKVLFLSDILPTAYQAVTNAGIGQGSSVAI